MAWRLQQAQFAKKGFRVILIIKRWQEKSGPLPPALFTFRGSVVDNGVDAFKIVFRYV